MVLEVLDGVDSPDESGRQLPERGEDEVIGSQGRRRTDLGGLLSLEARVDGQLALTLKRDAFAIQPAGQEHPPKQLLQLVRAQADVGISDD